MPLSSKLLAACPYFHPGDTLKLHPCLRVEGGAVLDTTLGIRHIFSSRAEPLLLALRGGVQYGQLRLLARAATVTDSQLIECLGLLNTIGGLQRKQTIRVWLLRHGALIALTLQGLAHTPLLHRYRPTGYFVVCGILRASSPIIIGAGIVATLQYTGGLYDVSWLTICCAVLFLVSVFAHEKAHMVALQRQKQRFIVISSPLRIGILHGLQQPRQELTTALLGPLAGVSIGLLCALGALLLGATFWLVLGAALCAVHCASLLPWYGDGKRIKKALGVL